MTADIVETTANTRAYTVPATVVASVRAALELPDIAHHDKALAERLVNQRQVGVDDVIRIHTAPEDSGFELRGGEAGHQWAEKIADGILRELDAKRDQVLERYDYNPHEHVYVGITAADNEDMITQVVRFPAEDNTLDRAEALTASGWRTAVFDFNGEDRSTQGVGLDSDLFAFTAAALVEDKVYGVLLAYNEPHAFLEDEPLLAAAPLLSAKEAGNVYAIVDSTDTTAIMDVIMIKPAENGALVYRRNGGMWQLDNTLLESFMSPNPPPIVELSDTIKSRILAQIDANSANQIITDDEGQNPTLGANAEKAELKPAANSTRPKQEKRVDAEAKMPEGTAEDRAVPGAKKPPENREKRTPEDSEEGPNSRPPVTASALYSKYDQVLSAVSQKYRSDTEKATAWYNSPQGYSEGFSLTAALARAEHESGRLSYTMRKRSLVQAFQLSRELEARRFELENIILPAVTAAAAARVEPFVASGNAARGQAEHLRVYWTKGKGAMKIRWGTKGDWRRCVRQLRKYLGSRTEGYCQNMHKRANGFYTGDSRNK